MASRATTSSSDLQLAKDNAAADGEVFVDSADVNAPALEPDTTSTKTSGTIADLGRARKALYPDSYKDISDADVGKALKAAFPDSYKDFSDTVTTPDKTKRQTSVPYSAVAKTIDAASHVLGGLASASTKLVLAPLAESLPISKEAKAAIEKIRTDKQIHYGSDVLQEVLPAFKPKPTQDEVGLPVPTPMGVLKLNAPTSTEGVQSYVKEFGKTVGRIAFDIITDPLSWVGVGLETKLGRLISLAHQAQQAAEPIKLSSPLAKMIAEEVSKNPELLKGVAAKSNYIKGQVQPSPNLIRQFNKLQPATTASQQVAAGQRSIATIINPLTNEPLIKGFTGPLAGKIVKPLSLLKRSAASEHIAGGIRELLSTKTGNRDYDLLYDKYKNIADYRQGIKFEDAKIIRQQIRDLSREMGKPPEVINREINQLLEQAKQVGKVKPIYDKVTKAAIQAGYEHKLMDAKVNLINAHAKGDAGAIEDAAKQVVDYNSELNKLKDVYTPPPSINPKLDKLINEIRERNERQLFEEQTSGVRVTNLLADRGYAPHISTPDANKAMTDLAIKENRIPKKLAKKDLDEFLANSIQRQFVEVNPRTIDAWSSAGILTKKEARLAKSNKDGVKFLNDLLNKERITPDQFNDAVHSLSINEVNTLAREGKLKNLLGDYKGDLFHTDPIYHTTVRGVRGEIARTNAEFFTELRKRGLALPEDKAPGNWVNVKQDELKGFKVPAEVGKSLNKWNEFNTQITTINKLLTTYDRFHSLNKIWTLAPFPAYHTKNAVGNFWNNFLAGLTNPDRYREALMTQLNKADSKYRPVNFVDTYGNKWNTDKLVEEANKLGVIGHGQYAGETQRTLAQKLESGKFFTFSSRNHFLRVGTRVGKFVEDNARMALFIDRLRKGDTAEQAALVVKKYLFDYGDLSDFERKVLNRVFFFYTWTRNNIPLQLHSLVTTPGKFGMPFKAKYEIEKNVPYANEKYLDEYMKDNFPTRIRYDAKTKKYEYFMLNNWLPAADLLKLSHLHDIALNMIAPLPKELLQQSWPKGGFDIYFQKRIENYPGEQAKIFNENLPVRVVHAAKAIRLLNEIDKLTKSDADLYTKMMGLLTGKNAMFDYNKSRMGIKGQVDDTMKALMSGYSKAMKDHNKPEMARLRALMQEEQNKAQ